MDKVLDFLAGVWRIISIAVFSLGALLIAVSFALALFTFKFLPWIVCSLVLLVLFVP